MERLKTLIHVHTDYSYDSNITPETLARFVEHAGIDCLAVTDHDTLDGAWRVAELTSARVVVGEEVSAREGHVIGLFLKRLVKPGMTARETALAIREQGGLVLAPHPFVKMFDCGVRDAVWDFADLIDAVEVSNAQIILPGPNRQARHFAQRIGRPGYVGADTHMDCSIAPCHQILTDFTDPSGFLAALARAELVDGRHPPRYFAATGYRTLRYYLGLPMDPTFGANHRRARRQLPHATPAGVT